MTRKSLYLFLGGLVFLGLATTQAQTMGRYTSGAVFEFGIDALTEKDEQKIESQIQEYEAQTGNQIGVVLVGDSADYARDFEDLIAKLPTWGYAPEGFLLVLDFEAQKSYLMYDNALEYAQIWSKKDTKRVVDEILPAYLQNNDEVGAVLAFVADIAREVPAPIAQLVETQDQKAQTAAAARGFAFRQGVLILLGLVFLILGAYGAYLLLQKWRKSRYLAHIQQFYNSLMPLFAADLDLVNSASKNGRILELVGAYQQDLQEKNKEITAFLEEAQKPTRETRTLANQLEQLEDELTYFVNHYADLGEQFDKLDLDVATMKDQLAEKFKNHNL